MEEKLIKELEKDLVQARNYDGNGLEEKQSLGKMDAEKEWNDSSAISEELFLHTKSYDKFISEDMLILLGRTGTGKTAILRYLEHNIKKGNINDYFDAIKLQFSDIILSLANYDDITTSAQVKQYIEVSIHWIIHVEIMKYLVQKDETLSKTRSYLKSINVTKSTKINLDKILETLKEITHSKIVEGALCATKLMNLLFHSANYSEAVDEIQSYLKTKQRKFLVLIDNADEYDTNDEKLMVVLKALISVCFDFYNTANTNNVLIKIALPSEVYSCIFSGLPGKHKSNTVVIQWTYSDLTEFIAKRINHYAKQHNDVFYTLLNAEKFNQVDGNWLLKKILPKDISVNDSYKFNTFAICVRNTLKKPRELLVVFNALFSKILQEQNACFFVDNPIELLQILYYTQEQIIGMALSMYNNTYSDIEKVATIILNGMPYFFNNRTLNSKLKEAFSAIKNKQYDIEDIKNILLESGLIGVVTDVDLINTSVLDNDHAVYLINAKFEHQIKGKLVFNNSDYYVMHPLCYQHFRCRIKSNSLVYFDKNLDKDDVIHLILKGEN